MNFFSAINPCKYTKPVRPVILTDFGIELFISPPVMVGLQGHSTRITFITNFFTGLNPTTLIQGR